MDTIIERDALASLEHDFEAHLVRGTHEYVAAWLTLQHIRDSEAWRGSLMSEGAVPQTFDEYVRDLVDRVRDRNPALPISRSTVFYNLRWLRRGEALSLPPERVLNAAPSVMNELSRYAEWDSDTGRIKRIKETVNIDALPGNGTPEERFSELVKDVVHSHPADAYERIKEIRADYSDEFVYHIARWNKRITSVRCNWTRKVNGVTQASTWHDLLREDMPPEVVADFAKRLGVVLSS